MSILVAIFVAFGLRAFRLSVSWEISQDEIDYLQITHGVVRTLWVVGWDGGPFYLHPPLFFFLEAAYFKLFEIGGDLISQIQEVRYLDAALGGLSAGALLWCGRRLAGWPAGIAAAAIFAVDPFCIRMNSRNFLDTPAVLWVVLGHGMLFWALVREDRQPVTWWRTIAAGILFGLALLTNEKTAFITLLPLGICFVLGWALPRVRITLAGIVALIVYAPYPTIVYARGDWDTFITQKFDGVLRMAGILQLTGFNQQGGPSFLETILYRLYDFATTYVLFAAGATAVGILLVTDLGSTPARRLLVSWTLSAYAFLAYAKVFGTIEEHFFYYLVVPCVLTTTVTTTLVLRKMPADTGGHLVGLARRVLDPATDRVRLLQNNGATFPPANPWRAIQIFLEVPTTKAVESSNSREEKYLPVSGQGGRRALKTVVAVFVLALAFWSAYIWIMIHTAPDNGYQRAVSYVDELPRGSRVAVTSETAGLLIQQHIGNGKYESVKALRADDPDYVVVSSYLATRGWREPPPEVYRWVRAHGQLVYGFEGNSSGLLGVWRLQGHAKAATRAPEMVAGEGSGAKGAL